MTSFGNSQALTRRAQPTMRERVCMSLFCRVLTGLEHGRLRFHFKGRILDFGQVSESSDLDVQVEIHDPAFFPAALFGGSAGVGRSYMEGHWSCADLTSLIRLFARNGNTLARWSRGGQRLLAPLQKAWLWAHRNHRRGSRRNIHVHYDLGDDFFANFLDPQMMYSAAYYPEETASLEEASLEKLRRIARKLELSPTDRVLEIGTGWGGFAALAAREFGCHVTTITISQKQYAYAQERIQREGLQDRVKVELCDYRDVEGQFDKVVSIEMIEAVGADYLDAYAEACGRLLTPRGRFLLQAIVIDDRVYDMAVRRVDFIKKYIFPGSFIPSALRIHRAMAAHTDLRITHIEDLTQHYVRTLSDWHDRFVAASDRIRTLGFDESFLRRWRFYFKYCEGGFAERRIGVQQMVFSKPFDRSPIPSGAART